MNVCSAVDLPDLGPPWITIFPADDLASNTNGSRRISKGLSISPSGQRHCRGPTPARANAALSGIVSSSGGSHNCGARGP
ncbi:Uncharacterised protein [Mycobacterium tuberculosis]|uniref:Uncharacterized protein n=1 Tax=Mycobacterium tuberculosis TaxID=1773 RepID=A0A655A8W3_MYCTX|nr:Uncharacterised protein [Mycobacterium tuberculosis]CFR91523.1 Uncharacterised protein [Mycobacterium tuberculosis]CFS07340.1 Uncharacterised protein [Mycobacterium tuberculosis]CFS07572.1 Uncharacterised protein [Mycobacterium tuberculosis]CKR85422.1 Uncharacterised protein [Mycobacterium tuberculosis]